MSKREREDENFLPTRDVAEPAQKKPKIVFTTANMQKYLRSRDSQRYQRAQDLIHSVNNMRLVGDQVLASVDGTQGMYRVKIKLREADTLAGSIVSMQCSCPDWGDPCKHAGAVLLKYAKNPGTIVARPSISDLVQRQDKSVLENLLVSLANRNSAAETYILAQLDPDGNPASDDDEDYDDDEEDDDDDNYYNSAFE
jgi:uncharacterized Zn finger protein